MSTELAKAPQQSTELVIRSAQQQQQEDDFMPVMAIERLKFRYNTVTQFAKEVMVDGRDYGVIPGTEKKSKPGDPPNSKNNTLLKPGAEKLCTLFGLVPDFQDYRVIEDWDKGLFYYAFRCNLSRNGRLIASSIGSANSREKKYRRGARVCPECNTPNIKKSGFAPKNNPNAKPGWYCHAKAGGCGANFEADDARVTEQQLTIDPNDAADSINTLQKMAQKRALVAATLIATNASEFFTQDVEDMTYIEGEIVNPPGNTGAGNGTPNLANDEDFLFIWDAAIEGKSLDEKTGRSLLGAMVKKRKWEWAKTTPAQRQELLDGLKAATPEQIGVLKKNPVDATPPAAAQPPTADVQPDANDVTDVATFLRVVQEHTGLTDEDSALFMKHRLANVWKKSHVADTPIKWRRELIKELKNGAADPDTGAVVTAVGAAGDPVGAGT